MASTLHPTISLSLACISSTLKDHPQARTHAFNKRNPQFQVPLRISSLGKQASMVCHQVHVNCTILTLGIILTRTTMLYIIISVLRNLARDFLTHFTYHWCNYNKKQGRGDFIKNILQLELGFQVHSQSTQMPKSMEKWTDTLELEFPLSSSNSILPQI